MSWWETLHLGTWWKRLGISAIKTGQDAPSWIWCTERLSFFGGGHIVLQRFVHVRCHFQPLPTKLVFAYFDRGSYVFWGIKMKNNPKSLTENGGEFHIVNLMNSRGLEASWWSSPDEPVVWVELFTKPNQGNVWKYFPKSTHNFKRDWLAIPLGNDHISHRKNHRLVTHTFGREFPLVRHCQEWWVGRRSCSLLWG